MSTVMTKAQRTHADKALASLEQSLTAVLAYGVASSDRDQLTAELTDIRAQRQALGDAHPNEAYRWTKAATARSKKLRRKHAAAFTNPQRATAKSPSSTPRSAHCTTAPAPRDADQHSPTPAPGADATAQLALPYTAEHRRLIAETRRLLLHRRARLHRSARVTTGRLRTAILTELRRVDDDLYALPKMSHRKTTACHDHHQHAEEQWNAHGAEVLV
jgi:hypothetical protein